MKKRGCDVNKSDKIAFNLNLDSLSFVQFIIKLEELTNVSIDDET